MFVLPVRTEQEILAFDLRNTRQQGTYFELSIEQKGQEVPDSNAKTLDH